MISRNERQNNNEPYIKKASTVIDNLDIVTIDGATGHIQPAVAGSTNICGIIQEKISATDSDYTLARPTIVDVPNPNDEFEIDVTGAVLTQAMVGDYFDLADAKTLNIAGAGTQKHCKVVGVVSNTVARIKFNPAVVSGL